MGITADTYDDTLRLLIELANYFVETETGRQFATTERTEYYDGTGTRDLVLRQRPVQSVTNVYVDNSGYYGQAAGAFASSTVLVAGQDYAIIKDDPKYPTYSKSGIVRWLGGAAVGWGLSAFHPPGLLTSGVHHSGWPRGSGNIKVVYTSGWTTAEMPKDLKWVALRLVRACYFENQRGALQVTQQSIGPFSTAYGYLQSQVRSIDEDGMSALKILRHYREVAL